MARIGPALEVFLQTVGLVLLVLVVAGLITRPFWPRITRYFRRWLERDAQLEAQRRQEAVQRQHAERELKTYCGDDIRDAKLDAVPDAPPAAARYNGVPNAGPQVQQVGKQENDAS